MTSFQHRLRRGVIHLDRDHVGNLHDPGFQCLHGVAGAGHQDEQHRVGDADHLDLRLPGAHGLEVDEVLPPASSRSIACSVASATAEMPARSHRADEDLGIEEVVREPDPVAEQRALRERAGRVDADHSDGSFLSAHVADERGDQRRLADRRAGR